LPDRLAGAAGMALVLGFCLLPLWRMVAASLQPEAEIFTGRWVPHHPTLDNYRLLLSGGYRFGLAVRNSLVIAGATTLVAVAVAAGAGYALARLGIRGRPVVLAVLLALAMFPGIALVPGLFQQFSGIGWIDTYQAVVLPELSVGVPLAAWLLARTLSHLSWELEDAARVDGAGRWTAFRRIVVPLAAPGVAAAAMVVFIATWNEYLFASAMTLTPAAQPVTVAITHLPEIGGFGVAMAAGILVTVPVVVVILVLQRHLASPLAGGDAISAPVGAVRRDRRHRTPRWLLAGLLTVLVAALTLRSSLPAPVPGVGADDGARIVEVARLGRRTVDLTVASPALGRPVKVRLLLPARFAAEPTRRWPVLYLLHGCCDSYLSWTRSTDVEHLTVTTDLLVVMPDGGPAGFYSDWYNAGRGGPPRWERFHLVELRQLLERNWRAGDRRAVAGVSMGGLGAMAYAARHPGLFRAAASFSGILDTRPDGPGDGAGVVLDVLRSQRQDPLALWGDPVGQAATWRDHDPYRLASRLRRTALFVAFGDGRPGPLDRPEVVAGGAGQLEARIHALNLAFVARLRTLGIPAQVHAYGPGTHDWPYWQRELHRALPVLLRSLGAPEKETASGHP
jgi:ABC-type glycerol-3-phosphate transport system permease component/S-formylglutathione hydrolase FrmB